MWGYIWEAVLEQDVRIFEGGDIWEAVLVWYVRILWEAMLELGGDDISGWRYLGACFRAGR